MTTLQISREILLHGLTIVTKAINSKTYLPILSNILFDCDGSQLKLSATDLQLSISVDLEIEKGEKFSTTVPAKLFKDLISILPDETISFEYDSEKVLLKVSGQKSNNNIKCLSAEEFPPFPVCGESITEMPATEFKNFVKSVSFCASVEETRPVLMGILMKVTDESLYIAAANGFWAARDTKSVKCNDFEVIVPAKVLDSILPVFEENIKISFSDKQAFFWDNQIQMSITLIEGQFPLVEQIVPKDGKLTATILVPELLSACKQVLLFTGGDWNPATLNFDNGICEISSSQDQSGDSIIQIAGRINENIKTALNTQTLIEFLNTVSENSAVEIYTKLPVTPIVFKIPEKENYLCIAMPIHLG